jgi:hypothetical protein
MNKAINKFKTKKEGAVVEFGKVLAHEWEQIKADCGAEIGSFCRAMDVYLQAVDSSFSDFDVEDDESFRLLFWGAPTESTPDISKALEAVFGPCVATYHNHYPLHGESSARAVAILTFV